MIVYLIQNKLDGRSYVGKTRNGLVNRWKRHIKSSLIDNSQYHLHCAIRKYGVENFEVSVLEECDSLQAMSDAEVSWITEKNSYGANGYNETLGGDGSFGFKHSEETKAKMRESRKKFFDNGGESSMKGQTHTKEVRNLLASLCKGTKRHCTPHTEEAKKKMSEMLKRRNDPEDPVFSFKLNPKQAVEQKARSLFGRDIKVKVHGFRPTPLEAKSLSVPSGTYYVSVVVDGQCLGTAYHFNWRKAYPLLNVEMQKVFDKRKAETSESPTV